MDCLEFFIDTDEELFSALNIISEKPNCNLEYFLKKRSRPIPEKEVLDFLFQIAMGLDHLHTDQHITHIDLKPSNIMVYDGNLLKIGGYGGAKKHVKKPHGVPKKKDGYSFYTA